VFELPDPKQPVAKKKVPATQDPKQGTRTVRPKPGKTALGPLAEAVRKGVRTGGVGTAAVPSGSARTPKNKPDAEKKSRAFEIFYSQLTAADLPVEVREKAMAAAVKVADRDGLAKTCSYLFGEYGIYLMDEYRNHVRRREAEIADKFVQCLVKRHGLQATTEVLMEAAAQIKGGKFCMLASVIVNNLERAGFPDWSLEHLKRIGETAEQYRREEEGVRSGGNALVKEVGRDINTKCAMGIQRITMREVGVEDE